MKYVSNSMARFCFIQYVYNSSFNDVLEETHMDYLNTLRETFKIDEINLELYEKLCLEHNRSPIDRSILLNLIDKTIFDPFLESFVLCAIYELNLKSDTYLIFSEYIKIAKNFDLNTGLINKILDNYVKKNLKIETI